MGRRLMHPGTTPVGLVAVIHRFARSSLEPKFKKTFQYAHLYESSRPGKKEEWLIVAPPIKVEQNARHMIIYHGVNGMGGGGAGCLRWATHSSRGGPPHGHIMCVVLLTPNFHYYRLCHLLQSCFCSTRFARPRNHKMDAFSLVLGLTGTLEVCIR